LKNVFEAAAARQKLAKNLSGKDFRVSPEGVRRRDAPNNKRSLRAVNEHFEPVINAAAATQIVFQQPVRMPAFSAFSPEFAWPTASCSPAR
jgi:hypothetical protein